MRALCALPDGRLDTQRWRTYFLTGPKSTRWSVMTTETRTTRPPGCSRRSVIRTALATLTFSCVRALPQRQWVIWNLQAVVHKRRGKVAWLEQVTAEQYEGRFDASRLMKKYAKGDRQTDRDVLPCSHRLSEEPWHAWTRRTNHDMFSDLS